MHHHAVPDMATCHTTHCHSSTASQAVAGATMQCVHCYQSVLLVAFTRFYHQKATAAQLTVLSQAPQEGSDALRTAGGTPKGASSDASLAQLTVVLFGPLHLCDNQLYQHCWQAGSELRVFSAAVVVFGM